MKVEVVSKEKIKPSSPTPHHLKTYSLSFLDQLALPIYFPLVLYYTSGSNDDPAKTIIERADEFCGVVKKSLAKTLTKFYPLAGKLIDDRFVECNDDGVDYVETEVIGCQLSQLIQHPNVMPERRKKLLPFNPNEISNSVTPPTLLSVQVNCFKECGGIVIGLYIYHKLADASTLVTFINHWANIARGIAVGDHDKQIEGPSFSLQSLFPQRVGDSTSYKPPNSVTRDGPPVTKKFVFEGTRLTDLKRKGKIANENEDFQDQYQPTRVEAVSALLWRCIIDMDQAKNKEEVSSTRACIAGHAVNMRSRMVPPLPPNSFGNMTCLSIALHTFTNTDSTKKNHQRQNILAGKIRESMKKIDGEYVKQLQTADTFSNALKIIKNENDFPPSGPRPLMLIFTSWCRFSVYEADFGWGKPIWASICTLPLKNMVLLMDTSSGDGIEAWVSLSKEDMYVFERHEELLASIS
ncbi:vinorine synthase-like [Papaver somniferum]|uniref:vinorine synthase-like n=1 Tax=Papaver somniferum TaxID=3469 RepID=UPI000E6FEBA7|nr:vinorine synthase-like [Papaver somniferum]